MASSVRVELPFTPRPHQREAHAKRKRFSVLVWHRRAGKTVFSILELLLAALGSTRESSRYGYVAPYLKQAKQAAWDMLKKYSRSIPGTTINESELSVDLLNGSRIRIYGADNPDSLRGIYFDGCVLDEVADMRPEVWGEIVRPLLADRKGWAIFIGTPKGLNLFSETYFRALKDPEWYADLRRAEDTGAIAPEELEAARREMSEPEYAQEFGCDFAAASENTLVSLEHARQAQKRVLAESEYTFAPRVLGVDVARYGGDRTVIFPRQGLAAFTPKVMRGADTMAVAGQVAESIAKWRPDAVFVDAGGPGAGVIDRLIQLGHSVIGIDFGGRPLDQRFENRRAEMWWNTAEWIKSGGCLPDDGALLSDLTGPTYTYANARGRLQLESKDDLRARGLSSPDLGDALALTFAAPVAPRPPEASLPGYVAHRCLTDHDPYQEAAHG